MLFGNAREYLAEVFLRLRKIGYETQLFLLNSSFMGVPQARQRVFFVARMPNIPSISMEFDEKQIPVSTAIDGIGGKRKPLTKTFAKLWRRTPPGMSLSSAHPKGSFFNSMKLHPNKPAPTLTASSGQMHWDNPEILSGAEHAAIQTFPADYNFNGNDPVYICGMSVPPLMIQRVAGEVAKALLASELRADRSPRSTCKKPRASKAASGSAGRASRSDRSLSAKTR